MRTVIIKNAPHEGPGTLLDYLQSHGHEVRIIEPSELRRPLTPEDYDALVPLGGPMNVYETNIHPHLAHVDASLIGALEADRPVLGICLGGQQLVKVSGGRVVRGTAREIGNFKVTLTPEGLKDVLFNGFSGTFATFQWHGDVMVPAGGDGRLAFSSDCPAQAVRVACRAYGIQFHFEATPEMVRDWCRNSADELAREGLEAEAIIAEHERRFSEFERAAHRLFDNFFEHVVRN